MIAAVCEAVLHQFVIRVAEMAREGEARSKVERVGRELGCRVMMKVADLGTAKNTRDAQKILTLFANEYWEFVFGKRGVDIVAPDSRSITFKDLDFSLITRVSGPDQEVANHYLEYIKCFILAMFKGSLHFLELKADIKLERQDNYTLIEVKIL